MADPKNDSTTVLATLTPEQRKAWESMQTELASMRAKIDKLETVVQSQPGITEADLPFNVVNRQEFSREVSRMLALDDRFGGTSSLLYFDFENLAALAKTGNRDVYNRAVLTIAKTLAGHVRNCDVVGKIGPSEFGVLLTRCDNVNAWKRAEVLSVNAQHQLALITGSEFKAEVGFGVHSFHGQGDVAEGLRQAATAMTRKKA